MGFFHTLDHNLNILIGLLTVGENMKGIDSLVEKALEFKEKGLTEAEIATELHLSRETVIWLLTRNVKQDIPPADVKIGWRSIGVFGGRMSLVAALFSDIIVEEMEKRESFADTIVGISINGIPFATLISEELGVEMAIYRPLSGENKVGAFSSNYASVNGKDVVIVDDVLNTGGTMRGAIEEVQKQGGRPVLALLLVNKTGKDDIDGVPLRSLMRARNIA